MFDIVAPDQHEAPAVIDRCRVRDRKTYLPVTAAGNEGSARYSPQDSEDDQEQRDHEKEQKNETHDGGSGVANNCGQPSVHDELSFAVSGPKTCSPTRASEHYFV